MGQAGLGSCMESGHSLGKSCVWWKTMVSGATLMSGRASLLVMTSGKFLNLFELQTSLAQGGDDTIPTVVGGPRESW